MWEREREEVRLGFRDPCELEREQVEQRRRGERVKAGEDREQLPRGLLIRA